MQTVELRPMTVGEIFDASFKLFWRHMASFMLMAMIIMIPIILLTLPLTSMTLNEQEATDPNLGRVVLLGLLSGLLGLVGYQLLVGTVTMYVSMAYLRKGVTGVGAVGLAAKRLVGLVILAVISGLFIFIGYLLLIVPGIILTVWLMVSVPSLMLEGKGPLAAMSRSRRLVREDFLRTLGLGVLVFLIYLLLAILAGIVGFLFAFSGVPPLAVSIASDLLTALVTPIVTIPVVLFYYDLRIRQEAFDLEQLAGSSLAEGQAGDPWEQSPPPPPSWPGSGT